MKTLRTVTLNKPTACGASLAEAYEAVSGLNRDERAELLRHLTQRFGLAGVRGFHVP